MRSLFGICAIAYLMLYAFEGAIRYGLYNVGADNLILLRDGLIVLPLAVLFIAQVTRMSVHPAYMVFAAIVVLHGTIATLNLGTTLPAIYGAKLLINVLFGFIAARLLTLPSRRVLLLLSLVWVASIVGVVLDKYIYTFPWMGLETHIGGIKVDISRGWDIEGADKRAAGFSRSSIAAAMLLPTLAMIIGPRIGSTVIRMAMMAITTAAVGLTTQKGSLAAVAAVGMILCAPEWSRYRLLCLACIGFASVDVALPLATAGLMMPDDGGGVFSFSSFAMRISLTWPDAWQWIAHNDAFPFGVGLGGIGGAQRFYAANFFNPSDNLFVFLYANFGLMGLFYLGWISSIGRGLPPNARQASIPPLAVLAFNLGYGAALSMLEDQMSALFIGASAGTLWQLKELARGGRWIDPLRTDGQSFFAAWRPVRTA